MSNLLCLNAHRRLYMRGNWILYASGYGVDFFVYGKTDLKSHPIYASAQIKFEQKSNLNAGPESLILINEPSSKSNGC